MEVNEQLVRAVTQAVVAQLMASGAQPQDVSSTPAPEGAGSFAGKTRMRLKHSYEMLSEHRKEQIRKRS